MSAARVSSRSWLVLAGLVAWTLFVWLTRIKNAWEDEALTTSDRLWTTALSLSFVVLAAGVGWTAARLRAGRPLGAGLWFVRLLAGWTLVVWLVRVPQILAAEHTVAFKAVHTLLGVISIALALWALRVAGRGAASAASDPGLSAAIAGR